MALLFLAGLIAPCLLWSEVAEAKTKRRVQTVSPSTPPGGVRLNTPTPRNPLQHNDRGVELGLKGLWPDAIREHEAALNGDPHNKQFRTNLSSAHLRYGDVLMSKKDYGSAMTHYREALYADPLNTPAAHNLSRCLQATGKNPDDYNTRADLADQAETTGNFIVAIVEARICTTMRDNGDSRFRLARVLYKQGKIVEAYEELRKAIVKDWPQDQMKDLSQCHALMGEILWDVAMKAKEQGRGPVFLKRLNNVAICYRRAATINPNNTEAIQGLINAAREAVAIQDNFANNLLLAGAYQLAGDFERSKAAYEKCWKLSPNSDVLYKARRSFHLATVSSPIASPAAVQSSLLKIEKDLERNPDDPELLYIYGRGKERLKEDDLALRAYQKAVNINPYVNPDLAQGIQRLTGVNPIASGSGDDGADSGTGSTTSTASSKGGASADEQATKAKQPVKKPVMKQNALVYERINNKIIAGDLEAAETELTALVDKDPEDGKAWLMLGGLHEQQGQMAQAKVAYRQAQAFEVDGAEDALRQIDSSRIKPLMDRAQEEVAKDDLVKAAATLKQAIQLAPELPEPHRKLQSILEKLGDKESAEKERKKADELDKSKK